MRMSNIEETPHCPECNSTDMTRLISSFAIANFSQDISTRNNNPNSTDYYKDPRNIGRQTEERFKKLGMELPKEIKEHIESCRDGNLPESMKDLKSGTSADTTYH